METLSGFKVTSPSPTPVVMQASGSVCTVRYSKCTSSCSGKRHAISALTANGCDQSKDMYKIKLAVAANVLG